MEVKFIILFICTKLRTSTPLDSLRIRIIPSTLLSENRELLNSISTLLFFLN